MKNQQYAFSLLELMIVVAIIGILAAVAYPSYIEYKVRSNRTDVQSEMMQQAQRLQSYYVINHTYTSATLDNGATTKDYPSRSAVYRVTLTVPTNQTYILTATPKTGTVQVGNGVICLDSQGQKYWAKAAIACALSITSNWDGR